MTTEKHRDEPFAWLYTFEDGDTALSVDDIDFREPHTKQPLYATPPEKHRHTAEVEARVTDGKQLLEALRRYEREALSPNNRDFYKKCADWIEAALAAQPTPTLEIPPGGAFVVRMRKSDSGGEYMAVNMLDAAQVAETFIDAQPTPTTAETEPYYTKDAYENHVKALAAVTRERDEWRKKAMELAEGQAPRSVFVQMAKLAVEGKIS